MEKKINVFFVISSAALSVSALIFLGISIFTEQKDNSYLALAFVCILLSNLFNIIRSIYAKRAGKK